LFLALIREQRPVDIIKVNKYLLDKIPFDSIDCTDYTTDDYLELLNRFVPTDIQYHQQLFPRILLDTRTKIIDTICYLFKKVDSDDSDDSDDNETPKHNDKLV
jgi:hypothetical protein